MALEIEPLISAWQEGSPDRASRAILDMRAQLERTRSSEPPYMLTHEVATQMMKVFNEEVTPHIIKAPSLLVAASPVPKRYAQDTGLTAAIGIQTSDLDKDKTAWYGVHNAKVYQKRINPGYFHTQSHQQPVPPSLEEHVVIDQQLQIAWIFGTQALISSDDQLTSIASVQWSEYSAKVSDLQDWQRKKAQVRRSQRGVEKYMESFGFCNAKDIGHKDPSPLLAPIVQAVHYLGWVNAGLEENRGIAFNAQVFQ